MKNNIVGKYIERVEVMTSFLPELKDRYREIEEISKDYFEETGEQLPSFLLEQLGTWYMQEIYSDNRSNKVAIEEYPILTEHQIYRRGRKNVLIEEESVLDTIQYHKQNNSSIKQRTTEPVERK